MALTSDDFIMLHKACENVIETEAMLDSIPPQNQITVLRELVKTLATVQRDLLRTALES